MHGFRDILLNVVVLSKSMGNTLLYVNDRTGDFSHYRPWEGGERSYTSTSGSLSSLPEVMVRTEVSGLFGEVHEPEAGIPRKDFGLINFDDLRPASPEEVGEVRTQLTELRRQSRTLSARFGRRWNSAKDHLSYLVYNWGGFLFEKDGFGY